MIWHLAGSSSESDLFPLCAGIIAMWVMLPVAEEVIYGWAAELNLLIIVAAKEKALDLVQDKSQLCFSFERRHVASLLEANRVWW